MAGGQAFWNPVTTSSPGTGGGSPALCHVREEYAQNTSVGMTSGAWQTRVLNTVKTNEITGASLSSNEITLPAGDYEVDALAPGHRVNGHQARLYDVTGAAVLVIGQPGYSNSAGGYSVNHALVRGRFTLGVSSAVRLEHRVTTTNAGFGGGVAANFTTEVYADVMIYQIA